VYLGGLGAGAFVHLDWSGWLVGAAGRVERVYNLNDTRVPRISSESVVLVGPSVGRRFAGRKVWVDVAVPLQLAFESSTVFARPEGTAAANQAPQNVRGASRTDVRLGGVLRVSFGLGGPFRLFGAFDADVSPGRLANPPVLTETEPRPPRWSTGLSAGVFWGAN
jgi:hypothetical protein